MVQRFIQIMFLSLFAGFILGCAGIKKTDNVQFAKRKYFKYKVRSEGLSLHRKQAIRKIESIEAIEKISLPRQTNNALRVNANSLSNNLKGQVKPVMNSFDERLNAASEVTDTERVKEVRSRDFKAEQILDFDEKLRQAAPISPPPDPPEWIAPLSLLFGLLAVPLIFYSIPLAVIATLGSLVLGFLGLKAEKLGFLASIGLVLGFVAFFLLFIVGIFYLSVWLAY